ncbi:phosphoribosylanthranilate isomerase [Staphylococcus warneri]|uniref:phosphoribosylanthranilate isomerase n=1 Tax=Staphylococcus warneri TaxID=1292 RepID=UPI00326164D9
MYLKFCGFKSKEDVFKAIELPIDAIGFIHFPKSRRHRNLNQIQQLSHLVPSYIDRVGVLVNPDQSQIQSVVSHTNINTIQFHGNEPTEIIKWTKAKYPNIKIIKALPAHQDLVDQINNYKQFVDLFIIDTPSDQFGGTGQIYDWHLLDHIQDVPFLIAGGLTDQHIKQIQHLSLQHIGYDVASGIETNHQKDVDKMKTIVNIVKGE